MGQSVEYYVSGSTEKLLGVANKTEAMLAESKMENILSKEKINSLNQDLDEARKAYDVARQNIEKSEERINQISEKLCGHENERDALLLKIAEKELIVAELGNQKSMNEEKIRHLEDSLKEAVDKSSTQMRSFQATLTIFLNKLSLLSTILDEKLEQNELRRKNEEIMKQLNNLMKSESNANSRATRAEDLVHENECEIEVLQQRLRTLDASSESTLSRLYAKEKEFEALMKKKEDINFELESSRSQIRDLNKGIQQLEQERNEAIKKSDEIAKELVYALEQQQNQQENTLMQKSKELELLQNSNEEQKNMFIKDNKKMVC
ncbi:unnamed protein product [Protopolystoma xenopodis]|uniref:Uncharacterized protein n=1 Tax=Protopolystoma xenopodis TaxID=117903 RepID=A0A3S5FCG6_9PLAT|nr:unnamed protein product [Protopolystoma xenopodis]